MTVVPRDLAAQLETLSPKCAARRTTQREGSGSVAEQCTHPATHLIEIECAGRKQQPQALCGDHAGTAARLATLDLALVGGRVVVASLNQAGDET